MELGPPVHVLASPSACAVRTIWQLWWTTRAGSTYATIIRNKNEFHVIKGGKQK